MQKKEYQSTRSIHIIIKYAKKNLVTLNIKKIWKLRSGIYLIDLFREWMRFGEFRLHHYADFRFWLFFLPSIQCRLQTVMLIEFAKSRQLDNSARIVI